MPKLILLLLFGIAMFLLLKRFQGKGADHDDKAGSSNSSEPERMVACAHCGVHIPESESLASLGNHYCSEEHRRLGPA